MHPTKENPLGEEQKPSKPIEENDASAPSRHPTADIKAILDVLGRRCHKCESPDSVFDLSNTALRGAFIYRSKLSPVNLYGADLSGSHIHGTDLHGAKLEGPVSSVSEREKQRQPENKILSEGRRKNRHRTCGWLMSNRYASSSTALQLSEFDLVTLLHLVVANFRSRKNASLHPSHS